MHKLLRNHGEDTRKVIVVEYTICEEKLLHMYRNVCYNEEDISILLLHYLC